jgi:large subunit ribosomal protein L24|uniref:Large ribosomal subunit protein uL24c n=3 Tax=Heterosigma akashiwo TaxID=2829 RepID=RK24_HETA2|nr:ribosomal protein L24 [Heterosigma akashiwo]B2XTE4.1 RecName: Full=Large ribosomal subunit protein uL24c; AltName: Full=50S ribosomal protein L24, chloroplastic [Heterosigma akashiwo NIES-293]B2XTV0.1 RecName: Full=Large ribosomal subunit protein uL24c; AltName: Full=50S ribosomal protein L24, chloroplastic [Heterosigma akashiwo CCMP452]ABV66042.1 50S ribosomal protein L24 [Heterosigma akashiwo]ABV70183.1 50S ribosomal protein L24 [Heterosigma akashiwo]BBA18248.1 50S ribosomal protein L2 [H|mmetsp:Transcript_19614/g.29689  ORF Transcript_19614/g.29689 Transcript_19614/m.29689 type:complete len:87 (-) Transcript_19614:10468-10728(-)
MKKLTKTNLKYKKQSLKIGDLVEIIAGNDKKKQGTVKAIIKSQEKVIVEGINQRFKHIKPQRSNETGKINQFEAPIHRSNVKKINN